MKKKMVSVVAPFFNEERGVFIFREKLAEVAARLPDFEFEFVCVNDGSSDSTLAQLAALTRLDDRVKVIDLSRNFGKEAALTAGLDEASGDAVIPIDADLQDPPDVIPVLIEKWQEGYQVVVGRRVDRSADSFLKRKTASLFYRIHNWMSDTPLPENVGDFRLMDRVVVDALKELPERRRFMKGLFAWVGFRSTTIDYARPERAVGTTKFSGWRLWNLALEGITSFSTVPLRVWSYVGFALAALGFSYASIIVFRTLVFGVDVPGYASMLTIILILGGMQLLGIGVLGEYLGRIYYESKQRPVYIVRARIGGMKTSETLGDGQGKIELAEAGAAK